VIGPNINRKNVEVKESVAERGKERKEEDKRRNPSDNNIKPNRRFLRIQGKGENLFIFRVYYFLWGCRDVGVWVLLRR